MITVLFIKGESSGGGCRTNVCGNESNWGLGTKPPAREVRLSGIG